MKFIERNHTTLTNLESRSKINLLWGIGACVLLGSILFTDSSAYADFKIPTLKVDLAETDSPDSVIPALKILAVLTILSVAPAILLMTTSFTRILIVLSFLRQALGTQTMPPNQVVIGLSMFLTLFTMSPVWEKIHEDAIKPYMAKELSQSDAIEKITTPMKNFMIGETRQDDLSLFLNIRKLPMPQSHDELSMTTVIPAFMISELKTAFQIGFLIYIPFLIIDMVISSILMAMGMMMLPPTVVSLPFKLVLFVLVDGWSLVVSSVIRGFQTFT